MSPSLKVRSERLDELLGARTLCLSSMCLFISATVFFLQHGLTGFILFCHTKTSVTERSESAATTGSLSRTFLAFMACKSNRRRTPKMLPQSASVVADLPTCGAPDVRHIG